MNTYRAALQFVELKCSYDRNFWMRHFQVDAERLEEAVKAVGSRADKVSAYLDGHPNLDLTEVRSLGEN